MSLIMSRTTRRFLVLAPAMVAGLGCAAAWALLDRMRSGTYDPHSPPSVLVGKRLPHFVLPSSSSIGRQSAGLNSAEITASRRPALVNFFASWCPPCIQEAAVLMGLKSQRVAIYGIAYKDAAAATARFLQRNGDPYVAIGSDRAGDVATDFGVYGVPETYVVDRRGIVCLRWAGPLTIDTASKTILPLLRTLA